VARHRWRGIDGAASVARHRWRGIGDASLGRVAPPHRRRFDA
jgi:hypothetical protein